MSFEKKRIFIKNLPVSASEEEIKQTFSIYGNVLSVEIKERKSVNSNQSPFFSYVNLEIDNENLKQCLNDFSNKQWLGSFVELQIAKESFLERLKKERDNNLKVTTSTNQVFEECHNKQVDKQSHHNNFKTKTKYKINSNSSNDNSETDIKELNEVSNRKNKDTNNIAEEEQVDIIIKNSQKTRIDFEHGLKIDSVGKEPIMTIRLGKVKPKSNEIDKKRLNGLKNIVKDHQKKQALIKSALSNLDTKGINNKIIFDDKNDSNNHKSNKCENSLFDDDNISEEEFNFEIKEHFSSKQGQDLLKLQSSYKGDKRFVLDDRFVDDLKESVTQNIEKMTFVEEKNKEIAILEDVLGKKIKSKSNNINDQFLQKKMLRYDPDQSDHSKYEIKSVEVNSKNKFKKKSFEKEENIETNILPEVSKDIFYKVEDDLKGALENNSKEFSLLGTFGRTFDGSNVNKSDKYAVESLESKQKRYQNNPFKYDSSDDENDNVKIAKPIQRDDENKQNNMAVQQTWTESFFFKNDDYRFQEGFDFIKRLKTEEDEEFGKIRREIKEIVKAKIRNNQRKNKPFKKKLGGNKLRKNIRIKKALKR